MGGSGIRKQVFSTGYSFNSYFENENYPLLTDPNGSEKVELVLTIEENDLDTHIITRYLGAFKAPASGTYEFMLSSDD